MLPTPRPWTPTVRTFSWFDVFDVDGRFLGSFVEPSDLYAWLERRPGRPFLALLRKGASESHPEACVAARTMLRRVVFFDGWGIAWGAAPARKKGGES